MLKSRAGAQVRQVTLATGVTLEYAEQGPRAGTPVIFLHGVTDSWRSFEGVMAHLPPDLHAYAISQRGHGNSSRPADGYLYRDMADDLNAFLDALGISAAVIAGHSMGAMVARQFALSYPSRLAGLVLIAGWATLKGHPVVREFVDSSISTLADPIDPAFVREFQMSTLARETPPGLIETAVAESLKVPARVWRAAFEGFLQTDCLGDPGRITAPVLIAWGERDSYVSGTDQEALMAAMPGSRFITYRGAGHAFHWEDPAAFAGDLTMFVRQIN